MIIKNEFYILNISLSENNIWIEKIVDKSFFELKDKHMHIFIDITKNFQQYGAMGDLQKTYSLTMRFEGSDSIDGEYEIEDSFNLYDIITIIKMYSWPGAMEKMKRRKFIRVGYNGARYIPTNIVSRSANNYIQSKISNTSNLTTGKHFYQENQGKKYCYDDAMYLPYLVKNIEKEIQQVEYKEWRIFSYSLIVQCLLWNLAKQNNFFVIGYKMLNQNQIFFIVFFIILFSVNKIMNDRKQTNYFQYLTRPKRIVINSMVISNIINFVAVIYLKFLFLENNTTVTAFLIGLCIWTSINIMLQYNWLNTQTKFISAIDSDVLLQKIKVMRANEKLFFITYVCLIAVACLFFISV